MIKMSFREALIVKGNAIYTRGFFGKHYYLFTDDRVRNTIVAKLEEKEQQERGKNRSDYKNIKGEE